MNRLCLTAVASSIATAFLFILFDPSNVYKKAVFCDCKAPALVMNATETQAAAELFDNAHLPLINSTNVTLNNPDDTLSSYSAPSTTNIYPPASDALRSSSATLPDCKIELYRATSLCRAVRNHLRPRPFSSPTVQPHSTKLS